MKCPPCSGDCDQGRSCSASLTTRNGGNTITNGKPLPPTNEADLSESFGSWVMCWIGGTVLGVLMAILIGAFMGLFI